MSIESLSQWVIAVCGGIGFFLIANKNPWGFVSMLITEPFWFVSTWNQRQWGMFALTVLYTVSCLIGIDGGFFEGRHRKIFLDWVRRRLFQRGVS